MFGTSVAQWHDGMWVVWRRDMYMSVSHEVFWEKEEIFADKNLDCKKNLGSETLYSVMSDVPLWCMMLAEVESTIMTKK